MIVKKYCFECNQCKELYFFEVDKPFSVLCPICNGEMQLEGVYNCDTDLADKVRNTPPYDPTKDPNSPYYIPVVKCPYCMSTNTSKISIISRSLSTGLFGIGGKKIGKQWHCNSCGSDF